MTEKEDFLAVIKAVNAENTFTPETTPSDVVCGWLMALDVAEQEGRIDPELSNWLVTKAAQLSVAIEDAKKEERETCPVPVTIS